MLASRNQLLLVFPHPLGLSMPHIEISPAGVVVISSKRITWADRAAALQNHLARLEAGSLHRPGSSRVKHELRSRPDEAGDELPARR